MFAGVRGSVLIRVSSRACGHIQRKIFDRILFAQAAALPSAGRSCFHDEERDARSIQGAGIEQRPQISFCVVPA